MIILQHNYHIGVIPLSLKYLYKMISISRNWVVLLQVTIH